MEKVLTLQCKDTSPGGYQSGQMGQTVNLLAYAYGGSNPSPPTQIKTAIYNYRAFARMPLVFFTRNSGKTLRVLFRTEFINNLNTRL